MGTLTEENYIKTIYSLSFEAGEVTVSDLARKLNVKLPTVNSMIKKLAAKKVDGVKDAKASYAKGTAEVTYDPEKTGPDAIARAIAEKTGYKTEVVK